MTLNLKTTLLGAGVLVLAGCSDFLELKPVTEITSANYWQTESDAEAAVIGCYDALQPDSYYGFDMYIYGDVRADNCFAGGDNPNNFAIDNFAVTPTNDNVGRTWRQIYAAVGRTNLAINRISQMDPAVFSGDRQNYLLGEAYFLRGLHYYNLVRLWGSVPLVLEETTRLDAEAVQVSPATEAAIYASIVEDLERAAELLPASPEYPGRLAKGAAETLRASVALTLQDYPAVLQWTQRAMTRGYALVPEYESLFDQSNPFNAEVIFAVRYSGAAEGNVFPELVLPTPEASYEFIKFNTPTPNSLAQYEAGDERAATAVVTRGGTPYLYKWRNGEAFASADYNVVLRYADVLLMRAEALNATGSTPQAIDLLDDIRNRAGLADYAGAQDAAAVEAAIWQERRVELMYEGHRWFDLLRQGLPAVQQAVQEAKGISVSADALYLPIPQEEIDRNPNLSNG